MNCPGMSCPSTINNTKCIQILSNSYRISESLGAEFTGVRSFSLMYCLDVFFQAPFLPEFFFTELTDLRYNCSVQSKMSGVTFLL